MPWWRRYRNRLQPLIWGPILSSNQWHSLTIALAGIAQAVVRVNELATTGYLNTAEFEIAVQSLFKQNPKDTLDVFGGDLNNLRTGLKTIIELIENPRETKTNRQLLGYCLGVFHLQKKLSGNPRMMDTLGTRLDQCKHQLDHFGPTHDNVVANLADIYASTISTFQFRIQVMGEYQYLQQNRVASQVRVLLFAAIRAATLWRQMGGSRWQLLIYKKKIMQSAQELQRQMAAPH